MPAQRAARLRILRTAFGTAFDASGEPEAQSSLAPRLADAGVPAILAMQGKISMETVAGAMPVFFRELLRDGQIDRALAVARATVRRRADSWMPALFLRLKQGRIWYQPGFAAGDEEFQGWASITSSVRRGEFVPILGPDVGEQQRVEGTLGLVPLDVCEIAVGAGLDEVA